VDNAILAAASAALKKSMSAGDNYATVHKGCFVKQEKTLDMMPSVSSKVSRYKSA
jgi:hypothetical protein